MTQTKTLCLDTHICDKCKQPCGCGTYTWACPWRNGDEIALCDGCLTLVAQEMEAWVSANGD